jgi:hypothetical protein
MQQPWAAQSNRQQNEAYFNLKNKKSSALNNFLV